MTDENQEDMSLTDMKFAEQVKAEHERIQKTKEGKEETKGESENNDQEEQEEEDPYLKEAKEMGYNPEYEGTDFVPPKEYVRVGKILKARDAKIDGLQKAVNQLLDHNKKVETLAYERAMKDLGAAKKEAIEEGNVSKVHQIDQEIIKTAQQHPVQQTNTLNKPTQDFVERNKDWFNNKPENVEITAAAIHEYNKQKDILLRKANLALNTLLNDEQEIEVISKAEKKLKADPEFSSYFEKSGAAISKKSKVGMVESPNKSSTKFTKSTLSHSDMVQFKQIKLADKSFTEERFLKLKAQVQGKKA